MKSRNDAEWWKVMAGIDMTSRNEMLKKNQLKAGQWYQGTGRNNSIALWDGQNFRTFGLKFNQWVEKVEPHWDDRGPFKPLKNLG